MKYILALTIALLLSGYVHSQCLTFEPVEKGDTIVASCSSILIGKKKMENIFAPYLKLREVAPKKDKEVVKLIENYKLQIFSWQTLDSLNKVKYANLKAENDSLYFSFQILIHSSEKEIDNAKSSVVRLNRHIDEMVVEQANFLLAEQKKNRRKNYLIGGGSFLSALGIGLLIGLVVN